MDIKTLILPEKVVTFEIPGYDGLEVDLAYQSKEELQKLTKKATKTKFNSASRQPVSEFDEDLFLQLYTKAIIKGWRGFKLGYLKDFLVIEIPEDMDEETEVEYSESNALSLIKQSAVFDSWVSGEISNLENFTKRDSKVKSAKSKGTLKADLQE